jgi:hypothetical protein
MCTPDVALYPLVQDLLAVLLGSSVSLARLTSLTDLVWALLASQSLHPADLARSLPHLETARARQAQRRVRRILCRPCLSSEKLTPLLIRAVLRLLPTPDLVVVLDWTRCQTWDVFTLGVRVHGRVFPIAWEALAYPWPAKQFTPTVLRLLERALTAWPQDRTFHLLADRGFPSLKLFRLLESWRQTQLVGYTLRLRASDYVRIGENAPVKLSDLEAAVPPGQWTIAQASYQHREHGSPAALLVIGKGIPLYPPHQMGPADRARRAQREAKRLAHLASKKQPAAAQSDRVWALLSTQSCWQDAVALYAQRFATEGTYRDLKSWDLAAVVARATDPVALDGLLGLAALGYLVQATLGAVAGQTSDREVRARQDQWSTTDRLSSFWRGRQVLHDRAWAWRSWLSAQLLVLTQVLGTAPDAAVLPSPPDRPRQEAA